MAGHEGKTVFSPSMAVGQAVQVVVAMAEQNGNRNRILQRILSSTLMMRIQ